MTDAIVRTLSRVYVTRRKLLEWVTAAQAKSGFDLSLGSFYRRMNGTVALAAAVAILVAFQPPEVWPIAAPFALLWALSPVVAYGSACRRASLRLNLCSEDEARTLRLTARRTWRFFETFVGPEDHALPPDNFQEEPAPVVAHRTVAHQPRAVSTFHYCGARFRVDRHGGRSRAARSDARHHERSRAFPGSLL